MRNSGSIRLLVIVLTLVSTACLVGCVQIPAEKLSAAIEAQELSDHVHFLTQPALKGRKPKTIESWTARRYLIRRFEAYGLESWGDAGQYEQPFGLGTNVIGVLRGSDETLAGQMVILSAHYDHVGAWKGKTYPGAADNASGVAALLEIAECLALTDPKPRRSVCFAAFDAEEKGLLGAYAFTCLDGFDASRIAAVVNVDMLGRDFFDVVKDNLLVAGTASYPPLRQRMLAFSDRAQVRIRPIGTNVIGPRGDHVPFEPLGIPCLFFTCGQFADYHTPLDTADKLDYETCRRTTQVIAQTVDHLANLEHVYQRVRPTTGDRDELLAIRALLQKIIREPEKAGLKPDDVLSLFEIVSQANQFLAAKEYGTEDRRRFIWQLVETLLPLMMRTTAWKSPHGHAYPYDQHLTDLLYDYEFFTNHRDCMISTLQKGMQHYLRHRPGFLRDMPKFDLTSYDVQDNEIHFTKRENGQYRLSYLVAECNLQLNARERRLLLGYTPHNLVGTKNQILDCVVMFWSGNREDKSLGQVWHHILKQVTGNDLGDTCEDWLGWRLAETGCVDERTWFSQLVGIENWRPHSQTWRLSVERNLALDPSYPFYDHPAMRLRRHLCQETRQPASGPAAAQPEERTDQDFSREKKARREWIPKNRLEKP